MEQSTEDHGKVYIAIDLKSFFASCECAARGLNPLTTNLVVADVSKGRAGRPDGHFRGHPSMTRR